jgi:hypothetical protein
MSELSVDHYFSNCFRQTVSLKEYQEILRKCGSWVFKNGEQYSIKGKKIGPGMYEIWLDKQE